MNVHELKTWPHFFQKIWEGKKRFEIRKNDRPFKEGDMLVLKEYDPANKAKHYTGRQLTCYVDYVMIGTGGFGLPKGYACMSLAERDIIKEGGEDADENY
jgi:hypothetical protein